MYDLGLTTEAIVYVFSTYSPVKLNDKLGIMIPI